MPQLIFLFLIFKTGACAAAPARDPRVKGFHAVRAPSLLPSQATSWQATIDSASGRTYYYHPVTRESRWRLEDASTDPQVLANMRIEAEMQELQAELRRLQVGEFCD